MIEQIEVDIVATIRYRKKIPLSPHAYEGATTVEQFLNREAEYLTEEGDYLISDMADLSPHVDVTVTPVKEEP